MSNGAQAPDTLPPDFFEKRVAPDTLPANFFEKQGIETPDAVAQARKAVRQPLDILKERQTAYSIFTPTGITGVPGDPELEKTRHAQKIVTETGFAMAGGAAATPLGEAAEGLAGGSKFLKWLLPVLARATGSGVGAGTGALASGEKPKEAAKTGAEFGAVEVGGETAIAGGGKVLKAIFPKISPLTKINELLGVGKSELRVGKAPATEEAFVTNPARGASKAGLTEDVLKKMNPLERNAAIVKAKDAVGKQLGDTFQAAGVTGKRVNLRQAFDDVFKNIPDKTLQKQTRQKLTQIVKKALGDPNVFEDVPYSKLLQRLDNLTPSQAHVIRMGLDDFASFAAEGTVKTFKDVATSLRRVTTTELRKVVPESAPLDQQYSDLAAGSKSTEKLVKSFVSKVPENKLKSALVKALIGGGAAGLGYEFGKMFQSAKPTPVP